MSSYKRFISYVYEYENNQKTVNRGFMKVESRNGICQMMFSLRGLCRDGNGSVKTVNKRWFSEVKGGGKYTYRKCNRIRW